MERNIIISLLVGYITALFPVWTWDNRIELFVGTITLSIISFFTLLWIKETVQKIKKALTSANVRASNEIFKSI